MDVDMESFSGIWVPLVTPFRGDGAVDQPALRALALRLAPDVAGFVVCGSTGEAHALDGVEQLSVLDTVLAPYRTSRSSSASAARIAESYTNSWPNCTIVRWQACWCRRRITCGRRRLRSSTTTSISPMPRSFR
jgi:hypothetical protein